MLRTSEISISKHRISKKFQMSKNQMTQTGCVLEFWSLNILLGICHLRIWDFVSRPPIETRQGHSPLSIKVAAARAALTPEPGPDRFGWNKQIWWLAGSHVEMIEPKGRVMKVLDARCRSCRQKGLEVFLDLGTKPPSDRILTKEMLNQAEPFYPLEVAFCPKCSLVQVLETVPPEELFTVGYEYYSSFIPTLLQHSRDNVLELIESLQLGASHLVVEVASNDGYLLKNYVAAGIPVLGIDPAPGQAQAAVTAGVPTLNAFFTAELAKKLRGEGKQADVVHANNVLAHVADTNGFVQGIRILLKDSGVAVIEVPYVKELIDHCEFDTIYHEHLCYFSVTALDSFTQKPWPVPE